MDILKNIVLNFNFFSKKINLSIIIVSFLIKLLIFFYLINIKMIFNINYFLKKFVFNSINKNKKIIFFFSVLMFLNILFLNLTDLMPNNLLFISFKKIVKLHLVPTSNINITFDLSIISFILVFYCAIKIIGFKNFLKNFYENPIKNKYMYLFNFFIESISFLMKPVSLSLRLFGNIFSSEIIFNLISKMFFIPNCILNTVWGSFHFLILPLQSFIFITLFIIYISQFLKH